MSTSIVVFKCKSELDPDLRDHPQLEFDPEWHQYEVPLIGPEFALERFVADEVDLGNSSAAGKIIATTERFGAAAKTLTETLESLRYSGHVVPPERLPQLLDELRLVKSDPNSVPEHIRNALDGLERVIMGAIRREKPIVSL